MTVVTVDNDTRFSVDLKRCYLPITVRAECPRCGEVCERDLSGEDGSYLSNFVLNEPTAVSLICIDEDANECASWSVRILIRVTAEVWS